MRKLNPRYFAVLLILTLLLFFGTSCQLLPDIGILPSPSPSPTPAPTPPPTPINPGYTPPPLGNKAPVLPSIADVVAQIKPSVVAINTEYTAFDIFRGQSTQKGAGSGWIIDTNGLIVTNNHVVEGAKSVTVTLADDRTFPAETIRTDAFTDLAIVKISASNLPAARVGDSSKLRVGDWVVAIGNPLGLGISAKEGIISRVGVSVDVASGQTLYDLVETSAAINPGNSGGPLVNMSGEVIGITSAKLAAVGVEGMGYAISANTARPIIEELIKKGYVTRPWLGVVLQDANQLLKLRYDLAVDKGAFITQIARNSPADKAGLKTGDVIVGFAGKEIATVQELIQAIHTGQIGQKVEITFWRGNTKMTTSAALAESPPP